MATYKYGDYNFRHLPKESMEFHLALAKKNELPNLPPKGKSTLITKNGDIVLTADGMLRKLEDYDADRDLV